MSQPTPPRGDAPERITLFQAGDSMCISYDETYKGNIPYIPEAHAEERIAEARLHALEDALTRFRDDYGSAQGGVAEWLELSIAKLHYKLKATRSEKK